MSDDEDQEQAGPGLDELRAKLTGHPGRVAHVRWDTMARSLTSLFGNFRELEALLIAPTTDFMLGAQLAGNMHPDIQKRYSDELDRRLLNCSASISALVDITRRITDPYKGTEFYDEYDGRKQAFVDSPQHRFVRDLRNFLLHYSVAPVQYAMSFDMQTGQDVRITLPCDALLGWGEWSKLAKRFITAEAPSIQLLPVITAYVNEVRSFYEWILGQFPVLHSDDVEQANALVKDYNRTLTGLEDWEQENFEALHAAWRSGGGADPATRPHFPMPQQ